jgi:hypothetical protein
MAIELDFGLQTFIRTVKIWFADFADIQAEFGTEQNFFQNVYPAVWER